MSPWSLLAVPLSLGGIVILLMAVSRFEERLLSPRSLILYAARSRHAGPDTAERFIAAQSEAILRNVPEGRRAQPVRAMGAAAVSAPAPTRP